MTALWVAACGGSVGTDGSDGNDSASGGNSNGPGGESGTGGDGAHTGGAVGTGGTVGTGGASTSGGTGNGSGGEGLGGAGLGGEGGGGASDPCDDLTCLNGGSCTNESGSAACDCADGFEGTDCGTNIDDCVSEPCVNGGTCSDGVDDFTCDCPDGYDGKTCSNDTDDCATDPCENGGTCADGVDDFTCDCPDGYDGKTCSNDIDDCDAHPCQNGGSCTDAVNGYSCACPDGYEGDDCETDIDDCAEDPCENGGSCTDAVDGYSCACPDGYEGDDCETDIDDCAGDPCENGGSCVDGVDSFTCTCPASFYGDACQARATDCVDVLAVLPGATNGVYSIDPDGSGTIAPFDVYCDMTTAHGPWTEVIDQSLAHANPYLPVATWRGGVTSSAPNGGQWSVLQHLAAFAGSDGYHFRLTYQDDESSSVTWYQTGNPLVSIGTIGDVVKNPVTQTGFCSGGAFIGLLAEGTISALNGAPSSCWWWAVGTSQSYTNLSVAGIPAYEQAASMQRARLYLKRRNAATTVCASALEHGSESATLSCPLGATIRSIDFASYGTPAGTCVDANLATSSCHAATSTSVSQTACIGKTTCSIAPTNGVFGDPCVGTSKVLKIQAICQ